jgi:hypothetical protein
MRFCILILLLSGCNVMEKMKTDIYFVTTDNKKYQLRVWDTLITSSLPNGFQMYPNFTFCQDAELAGASTNAWEPTLYNVRKDIIPISVSQYAFVNNFATPGNRNSIYRFSTPYLIERGALPGKNSFAAKIAPYTRVTSLDTSFYAPAGTESVAYNGNVAFEHYENVAFSSKDFRSVVSPDGVIKALVFDPTVNVTAYTVQQQQTIPQPMRSPVANDYNQLITIGYNPNFGGAVNVSVHTVFLYFELE